MEKTTFKMGDKVMVNTRRGQIEGIISSVDMNIMSWDDEYSVDYLKDGKTWTMICVPTSAISLR